MKKKLLMLLIVIITNIFTFVAVYLHFTFTPGNELFPENIIFSVPAPAGKTIALILQGSTGAMLGGERYYLALRKGTSTYLIMRELSEGQGNYEAGILAVRWINTAEILVEQILYDRRNDLIFNIETHEWKDVVASEAQGDA